MENEGLIPRQERSHVFGASYELLKEIEESLRTAIEQCDITRDDLVASVSAAIDISTQDVDSVLLQLNSYSDKDGFVRLHSS